MNSECILFNWYDLSLGISKNAKNQVMTIFSNKYKIKNKIWQKEKTKTVPVLASPQDPSFRLHTNHLHDPIDPWTFEGELFNSTAIALKISKKSKLALGPKPGAKFNNKILQKSGENWRLNPIILFQSFIRSYKRIYPILFKQLKLTEKQYTFIVNRKVSSFLILKTN